MRIPGTLLSRRKALTMLVISCVVAASIATCLFLIRSRSVLYRGDTRANPIGEPEFTIFNPFRDRQPEQVAETFLNALGSGSCLQAVSALPIDAAYREYICDKEKEYPLASWQIKNRTDEPNRVKLFYWCQYRGFEGQGRLWVTIDKAGERWVVTEYERYY